jgi:hypothetical protein
MNRAWNRATVALAVGFVLFASILLYAWTVQSTGSSLRFKGAKSDYYNLLVQGFRNGHLFMNVAPDPSLLALPARERPGYAPFLLDASLYHERYYLYFGVVPAALLFLPYAVLSGQGLPEAAAVLVFASAGVLFSALWWLDARKCLFPASGWIWAAVSILGLSLGSAVLSTLRRPLFYEVAITAGYSFMMLSLWAFLRARISSGRWSWLVLGAAAAGLAVGSRPNLGLSCIPLVVFGAIGSGIARQRGAAWAILAAGLVFGVMITTLGVYNMARFGNPLEFGYTYQFGVRPLRLFHLGNFFHNARIYYLQSPALNGYFPFVAPGVETIKPNDYVGRETAHGEWVWLPLTLAALGAVCWSRMGRRAASSDYLWVLGMPAIVFAVNFVVTASTGVRANRYMLDFHPMLVLATVAGLGLSTGSGGWAARAGKMLAGLWVLVAAAFNLLGSLQAQGLFRATDPIAYSAIASVADRIAWPLLRGGSPVGDRVVNLRWPGNARPGLMEPICAAGTPDNDDILWLEYAARNSARISYQYSEFGRSYGSWFAFEPGRESEIRISGALLLPPAGHPWFGARAIDEQIILKRHLLVLVNGISRFDRDVPSHDSSPRLESWGTWRDPSGAKFAFSGQVLKVNTALPENARILRSMGARGPIKLRLMLPPRSVGRYEPLLQSGTPAKFDTLVLHNIRAGRVELIHDQLGSGARRSEEFAVDYSRMQEVEVELPFADDKVDWDDRVPVHRASSTERMKVFWNGRSVFEPEVAPVPGTRPLIILGANILHSSVSQAMFEGGLTSEPPDVPMGDVEAGDFCFRPAAVGVFDAECGILLRFEREDGAAAFLSWRTASSGVGISLGWTEGGRPEWSSQPMGVKGTRNLIVSFSRNGSAVGDGGRQRDPDSIGRLVVESGHSVFLALRTAYFSQGPVQARGSGGGEWSRTATTHPPFGNRNEAAGTAATAAYPGKVRIAFLVPSGDQITRSPILEVGRVGAADSIYLRSVSGGRYTVGLDHWSVGTIESPPFELRPVDVHQVGIEMSSLESGAANGDGSVRISVDGKVVLDRTETLYGFHPDEVFFGSNPLSMSTSVAAFEGDLISIRTHQPESDLFYPNP